MVIRPAVRGGVAISLKDGTLAGAEFTSVLRRVALRIESRHDAGFAAPRPLPRAGLYTALGLSSRLNDDDSSGSELGVRP